MNSLNRSDFKAEKSSVSKGVVYGIKEKRSPSVIKNYDFLSFELRKGKHIWIFAVFAVPLQANFFGQTT
jgi:hypothetical protein